MGGHLSGESWTNVRQIVSSLAFEFREHISFAAESTVKYIKDVSCFAVYGMRYFYRECEYVARDFKGGQGAFSCSATLVKRHLDFGRT